MREHPSLPAAALLLAALIAAGSPVALAADAGEAAALCARFGELRGTLERSPFGRPLVLSSRDQDHVLAGDVYARLSTPFARVEQGLDRPVQWCDVLELPFNIKRCEARGASGLALFIARHKDSGPGDTYRIDFRFDPQRVADGYLRIALAAPSGPLGTRDYRIVLEATPAESGGTLLHFRYSYGYGWMSEVAMRAYLATAGAGHVGFSKGADGALVGGMRGVTERNTMRYYLAIEAYLASLTEPPAAREDARLAGWFDAVEHYPRQLHEMDRAQYLAMKHRELRYAAGGARAADEGS